MQPEPNVPWPTNETLKYEQQTIIQESAFARRKMFERFREPSDAEVLFELQQRLAQAADVAEQNRLTTIIGNLQRT